jgi:xeroderma pigmentosum group C-complementing protein
MSNAEVFLSREDFISQAKMMQGSRDFGAQLFCALLRSVAIESRLVCSLQALPFSGTVKDMTPSKKGPEYIVVSSDDHETSTDERKIATASPSASRVRRLGRPEFKPRPIQPSARLGTDC